MVWDVALVAAWSGDLDVGGSLCVGLWIDLVSRCDGSILELQ